jgi:hypothetical protein
MLPSNPLAFDLSPARSSVRFGDAPTGPASPETPANADDLDWDDPNEAAGEAPNDDENWDPDDDEDLGLDDDDDDESVGLDTDTGFDDGSEDLELDDSGEGERWTVDSEPSDELAGAEAEVISGAEYGWIGDDDPTGPDEDIESDLDDDELSDLDDGGAEGVEDESDLDDLELGRLPELDAGSEEEAEGFMTENFEELAGVSLTDEAVLELLPGQPWKLLSARAVQTTRVATLPGPALALATYEGRLAICAGDGWYVGSARGGLSRLSVDAPPGRSLALADHDGRPVFALASTAGLYVSTDSARSFERQRDNDPPTHVAFTHYVGKLKVWARNQRGMLLVSDDLGRSFSPARLDGNVIAFATDGERRLCALVKRAGRTALGSSNDAGRRWSWVDAADSGGVEGVQLLPGRGVAVIAGMSRLSCFHTGEGPRTLAPLLGAPAALLDEDDETFVYACVPHEDQVLIVRCATRTGAQPMVVASLARERVGEPRCLTGAYADGGFVTLHVATDQALLRIEASLDGEDLP